MKKLIVPDVIPESWDAEALYAKAERYIERMLEEDSDGWEHALWSSLALELLARAALSNITPALLAETGEKNWQHLFHSLGFTPTESKFSPRSIGVGEVLKRLRELLPEFNNELEAFCVVHTGRRNAELHSGVLAFDGVPSSAWHPKFYRSCGVLLKSMGYELKEFVGDDEAEAAEKLIAAAQDEAAKSVKGDVEAHRKVWLAKDEADRQRLVNSARSWAIKQAGHRVKCPACSSDALVIGEPVGAPHKTIEDDEITESQTYLPTQFQCIACDLKVMGLSRLSVIDLGARYKKTLVYDAADYYAVEDDYSQFEDDNNEPM